MAEILGLGVTHSPLLVGTDDRMAGIFERVLNSERLPPAAPRPCQLACADAAGMGGAPGRPSRTRASAPRTRGIPRRTRGAGRLQAGLRPDLG